MKIHGKDYKALWMKDDKVFMINQKVLPYEFEVLEFDDHNGVAAAIKDMTVRGAPAIGIAAAYAFSLAIINFVGDDMHELKRHADSALKHIASTRPTAYDLFHSLKEMEKIVLHSKSVDEAKEIAKNAAIDYDDWIVETCKKIGEYGNELIKDGMNILTHCNAGALATGDYGTALAPMRIAHKNKKKIHVWVDETRPRMQGLKLTAFELNEEKIPNTIISDNTAGMLMQQAKIDMVIVGADRIALNGDFANKIGTYEKAVLAKENNIPFYVAAPTSTIDINTASGKDIPIEERSHEEVEYVTGIDSHGKESKVKITPDNSKVFNPAFDVTPARYVKGIITEKGIIRSCEEDIMKVKKEDLNIKP